MAIYVNKQHVPEDGERPWKHLDLRCSRLQALDSAGYTAGRVPNIRRRRLRRCPECFVDGGELLDVPTPAWLKDARDQEAQQPGMFWTYDLMYPDERLSQVGMATHLHDRLAARFRATCRGRFGSPDSIPWCYDLLAANPAVELSLDAVAHPSRDAALKAEDELRRRKREQGWQVSSDR